MIILHLFYKLLRKWLNGFFMLYLKCLLRFQISNLSTYQFQLYICMNKFYKIASDVFRLTSIGSKAYALEEQIILTCLTRPIILPLRRLPGFLRTSTPQADSCCLFNNYLSPTMCFVLWETTKQRFSFYFGQNKGPKASRMEPIAKFTLLKPRTENSYVVSIVGVAGEHPNINNGKVRQYVFGFPLATGSHWGQFCTPMRHLAV